MVIARLVTALALCASASLASAATSATLLVEARPTGLDGAPLLGLGPADFRVQIDGVPVTDFTVHWNTSNPALDAGRDDAPTEDAWEPEDPWEADAAAAPGTAPRAESAGGPIAPPADDGGRLIVLFFQRDLERSRALGLLRATRLLRETVARLRPKDHVAVVTFDSRLDLQLDFTTDREALRRVIDGAAARLSRPAATPGPEGAGPTLAAAFGRAAGRDIATIEDALAATAAALEPIPGPKALLFFAWSIGRLAPGGSAETGDDFERAVATLIRAHAAVYTLDVVEATSHSSQNALKDLSVRTGGAYQKVTGEALERVERSIGGRYALTFAAPALSPGRHRITVALAARPDDVIARATWDNS